MTTVQPGDAEYDELAADMKARGATMGAMFGRRALKRQGRVFALLQDGALCVSLGEGTREHAEALGLPGAALFDPSRRGRPFKDWVAIPVEQVDHWMPFAAIAYAHVAE